MVKQSNSYQRRSSARHPCPSSQRLFHGVRLRSRGRWVSEIRIPNSRDKIWLGSYTTPEEAARAYDIATLLLCRPFPLNFSDTPSLLNLPHLAAASSLLSRRSIQATAYLAARSAPGCANINYLHPAHEAASSADWMQDLRSLLAPEEPDTTNGGISTCNIGAAATFSMDHGVLDAGTISLSFDAAASCSAGGAAAGELEEEVLRMSLEDVEYEEAFLEMIAVDGFTAISATVTARQRIASNNNM